MEVKYKAPKAGKSLLAKVAAKEKSSSSSGRGRGGSGRGGAGAPREGGGVGAARGGGGSEGGGGRGGSVKANKLKRAKMSAGGDGDAEGLESGLLVHVSSPPVVICVFYCVGICCEMLHL